MSKKETPNANVMSAKAIKPQRRQAASRRNASSTTRGARVRGWYTPTNDCDRGALPQDRLWSLAKWQREDARSYFEDWM